MAVDEHVAHGEVLGRVTIRARHEFEDFGKDRTRIVINEIPYQVNKRQLIKNMADQVEDKRLEFLVSSKLGSQSTVSLSMSRSISPESLDILASV